VAELDNMDSPSISSAASTNAALAEPSPEEQALVAKLRRTSELVSAQRLPEAEAELLVAQNLSPRDLRVLKLLALVRFKLGRLAEARQVYREASEVAPDDPTVRLNLGLIALKLDSFAEAALELEATVRLQPDDRRAWSYLGYAYARNASPAQAATAFRRAGQHELAAEMERAATPPLHAPDSAVVEGLPLPTPAEAAASRPLSPGMATPRPALSIDVTPVPALQSNYPGIGSEEMVTLGSFATARLLSLALRSKPVASLGQGVLRFSAGLETHVRQSTLLVALGGQGLSLGRRRTRGHLSDNNLASDSDRFFRVEGGGDLLLFSSDPERGLVALALDHDVFYVEEDRVVAWGDEVVWESGSVPGNGKALLQFRGTGRVVLLVGENELVAVRIAEGDCMTVPIERLAGWLGRVVVQGQPAREGEATVPGLHHITCEGEGVLLLSRHGEHR
jgi:Flp pilus assembly protein TadD